MIHTRVLVIEHDLALQTILSDWLRQARYQVDAAVSAGDPRALVGRFQPAVVVIGGDRHGTFAAGWQAAQRIAAIAPALPLVMLTADQAALHEVGRTQRGRCFAAGLRKPFRLDALIAAVAGCLVPPHAPPTTSAAGRLIG